MCFKMSISPRWYLEFYGIFEESKKRLQDWRMLEFGNDFEMAVEIFEIWISEISENALSLYILLEIC